MLFWLSEGFFVMNPAVFSDSQVTPQLAPSRGRGRPTLYCPELIEEFCGLIVDGMTIDRAFIGRPRTARQAACLVVPYRRS